MASKMTHAAHKERAAEIQRLRPTTTMDALAVKFDLQYSVITRICRGIEGPAGHGIISRPKKDRHNAEELRQRYRHGETLAQIGDSIGVSRERVRQIIQLTRSDGGDSVAAVIRKSDRNAAAKLTMEYWRTEFRRRIRAAGWRKCVRCHCYGQIADMTNCGDGLAHFGCLRQYQRLRTSIVCPSANPGGHGWGELTPEQRHARSVAAYMARSGGVPPAPEDPYYTALVRYPARAETVVQSYAGGNAEDILLLTINPAFASLLKSRRFTRIFNIKKCLEVALDAGWLEPRREVNET